MDELVENERKIKERHRAALKVCCSTLDNDVPLYSRLATIRLRAGLKTSDLEKVVPGYLTLEDHELWPQAKLADLIAVARFYGITLSTLLLNVDMKRKPKFI